jgi:NDP-sugar pyrophosphorylase family protein
LKPGEEPSAPKIKTAIIMAGGEGLRLRPLTTDKPKVMISVAGKPILDWILQWLVGHRISHIVVGVAYKKELVIEYVQQLNLPVQLDFSEHTVEGGTGEGFRLAMQRFVPDAMFLAMNGDEITDINIPDFAEFHLRFGGLATIAVANLKSPFGVVHVDNDRILDFEEKAVLDSLVSTGVYIFSHGIVDFLPVTGNIEIETFPQLAHLGKIAAYRHNGFWGTVNTLKDLRELETELTGGILTSKNTDHTK